MSSIASLQRRLRSDHPARSQIELLEPRRLLCDTLVHSAPLPLQQSADESIPPAVPIYHSRPQARVKLFLDLDGYIDPEDGLYGAYDFDGDRTTFSAVELEAIHEIWARVTEKYSPFDIDVTTEEPADLSGGTTLMVRFGGYNPPVWGVGLNGAFLFTNGRNWVRVFSDNAPQELKTIAEVAAHESGHGFGLQHQSLYDANGVKIAEYNPGTSEKGPIMGFSSWQTRGLWWYGQSSQGANFWQDDVAVITRPANGFGFRADDHGDQLATATALSGTLPISAAGVIERQFDVDLFSLDISEPVLVRFEARTAHHDTARIGMLDASLAVLDSVGTPIATAATTDLDEALYISLSPGRYYVRVSGAQNYGDIGQYSLNVTETQIPYPGPDPASIPGQIEMENYDSGADGIAYHDTDSINVGGFYRNDGVDIYNYTADTVVGLTLPGEWLEYSMNVQQYDSYDLRVRARGPGAAARFHVEIDGTDVTGPLVPHNAGSGSDFGFSTKDGIVLSPGPHIIRIAFDQAGAWGIVGEFDWFTLTPSVQRPFPGPDPGMLPGTIQMENYDAGGPWYSYYDTDSVNTGGVYRNDGVDIFNESAPRVGETRPGESLHYTVQVTQTGNYDFEMLCGVYGSDAYCYVTIDGNFVSPLINVHDMTADGQLGIARLSGFTLMEGLHVIRIAFSNAPTGGQLVGEFDWFRFVPTPTPWWLSPSPGAQWQLDWYNNLVIWSGTVTLIGDAVSTHPDLFVNTLPAGNLVIESSQHLGGISSWDGSTTSLAAGRGVIVHASYQFVGVKATLDLNDNAMLIDYPNDDYARLIASARAGGAWTGPGITSSSARNNPSANTTIGLLSATEYRSVYGENAVFHGEPVIDSESAVLLQYTYYGDTDFNGRVDFDDYTRIDLGFAQRRSGWFNGDFDGNGIVDFDDYALIDLAFNTQSGTLRPGGPSKLLPMPDVIKPGKLAALRM